jgi:hypothetical protein
MGWTGDGWGGDGWRQIRTSVLAGHRTLRSVADCARTVAQAVIQGEPLGVVALPYAILGLHRSLEAQFVHEESLVCPLLEAQLPHGPAAAEALRAHHLQLRAGLASLASRGTQPAVTAAVRLLDLSSSVLSALSEEERTLWHAAPAEPPAVATS